ncbi:hypothetical protein SDRG_07585 [Saprolegnia diclina VS20]|uniref:Uncharacterized protein n=1 Tax=Saprolegnia diclina (strain VS20) TaxID=1156394 RepID=T0RWP0_SAPDV|nr:hypothetical protein SDRG_07585 [Saprolegnia diclina VS20]EQC34777.1 hypothetical protein SDRG_07585 [Saprolegnia diclina VS20]|eukprot:XP_008611649.1 hypothetical protein SDRG_07585 [Saprolegnia diclina VS20]
MIGEMLNVLQSIQLLFALLPILHFTSHVGLLGAFVNSTTTKAAGWAVALLVCLVNLYLVMQKVDVTAMGPASLLAFVSAGTSYAAFLAYLNVGGQKLCNVLEFIVRQYVMPSVVGMRVRGTVVGRELGQMIGGLVELARVVFPCARKTCRELSRLDMQLLQASLLDPEDALHQLHQQHAVSAYREMRHCQSLC